MPVAHDQQWGCNGRECYGQQFVGDVVTFTCRRHWVRRGFYDKDLPQYSSCAVAWASVILWTNKAIHECDTRIFSLHLIITPSFRLCSTSGLYVFERQLVRLKES